MLVDEWRSHTHAFSRTPETIVSRYHRKFCFRIVRVGEGSGVHFLLFLDHVITNVDVLCERFCCQFVVVGSNLGSPARFICSVLSPLASAERFDRTLSVGRVLHGVIFI